MCDLVRGVMDGYIDGWMDGLRRSERIMND